MPKERSSKGKKPTVAPYAKEDTTIFKKSPRNFNIGQNIQPKRDLSRFVKWPRYIRMQRQKAVLYKRLKIPPSINQFNKTLDKDTAVKLFNLLNKYRPEDKQQKKERLRAMADMKAEGKEAATKKPVMVKYGLNHVTTLIEQNKAQLVVIAHDVDPIELVVWLPALCRKKDIPYCIVKGKARLGQVVHKKTSAVLAVTEVRKEDMNEFKQLASAVKANFTDTFASQRKQWGGGIMGLKSQHKLLKREKARQREEKQRMGV